MNLHWEISQGLRILQRRIPQYLKDEERKLGELKEQFEAAKVQAERPFSEEEKLSELLKEPGIP